MMFAVGWLQGEQLGELKACVMQGFVPGLQAGDNTVNPFANLAHGSLAE